MTITFKSTKRGIFIRATGGDDCRGVLEAMTSVDKPVQPSVLKRAMKSKAAQRNPEVAVATWNNAVNVGDLVDYRSDPYAQPQRFKTRCRAEVLSGHTPVTWLEGKSGCVTLESLTLVTKDVVEGGAA